MINKLLKTSLSLILVFFIQSSYSDDLIPAEHFACYGNSHSMQLSPDGRYLAILTQPKENKCDIEPDLQKYVEDDFRGGMLVVQDLSSSNKDFIELTSGRGNSSVSSVKWIADDRIIFTTEPTNSSAKSLSAYRLMSMNIDRDRKKRKSRTLYEFKTAQGMLVSPKITSLLPDEPDWIMVKINERRGSVDDYYRLNVKTELKNKNIKLRDCKCH